MFRQFAILTLLLVAACDSKSDRAAEPQGSSMNGTITAAQTIQVGQPVMIQGNAPSGAFGLAFEDDGDTGYVYLLDFSRGQENMMVDAMHIYNVQGVTDREKPAAIEILWSADSMASALLINGYPHAVADFSVPRAYCRSGFPPADPRWTQHSHEWSDDALNLFR